MSRMLTEDAPDFTDFQVTPQTRLRFQRIDPDGKQTFLHMMDLNKTTRDPNWAWSGVERQALNVRAKFPHAREFSLVRINHSKSKR